MSRLVYRQLLEFPFQESKEIPVWLSAANVVIDISDIPNSDVIDVAHVIQYQFREALGWVKGAIQTVTGGATVLSFDASYPYKIRVLPVKRFRSFTFSIWLESTEPYGVDFYSGSHRLNIKAPSLSETYSLLLPASKPAVGQVLMLMDVSGQMAWVTPATSGATTGTNSDTQAQIDALSQRITTNANAISAFANSITTKSLTLQGEASATTDIFNVKTSAGVMAIRVAFDGAFQHGNVKLGLFNATPGGKPNVSGSTAGNVALQSVAAKVAATGLITNNTTA